MDDHGQSIGERVACFQRDYESYIRRRAVNCSRLNGSDPEEIQRTLHQAGLDSKRCGYICCRNFEELVANSGLKDIQTTCEAADISALKARIRSQLDELGVALPQGFASKGDELWLARLAAIEVVLKLAKIGRRCLGNNSMIPMRKLPKDGSPCKLKRHFKGCLRQVIGFAELMAGRDPERFIWAKEAFFKHARKRKGGVYSKRQVLRALSQAEQAGILAPVERIRNGVRLRGFLVHNQDDISYRENGYCFLPLSQKGYAIRRKSQKRSAFSVMTECPPPSSVSSDVAAGMSTRSTRVSPTMSSQDSQMPSEMSSNSPLAVISDATLDVMTESS